MNILTIGSKITLRKITEEIVDKVERINFIDITTNNYLNWGLSRTKKIKYYSGDIKKIDLRIDHPYNTYRYKGLPPGPISTVSEDSLKAALNPLKTDFLYFVSMGNGFHKFSKTLSEHNEAVLKYQINGR